MPVKLRIVKSDDGKLDVVLERTRWSEGETRQVRDVAREDLERTVAQMVEQTRGDRVE